MKQETRFISQRQAAKELGFKAVKSLQEYIQKGVVETNDEKKVDPIDARKRIDIFKKLNINDSGSISLLKARTMKEEYQAKMAELDYKVRTGELLQKDEIYETAFMVFRELRDALYRVPGRIAPILAHETDIHTCKQIIQNEITAAIKEAEQKLNKLTKNLK